MVDTLPLMLEAYDSERRCVDSRRALPEENTVDEQMDALLALPNVRYLHIRNAEAGCFIAHVEPVRESALVATTS